MADKSLRVVEFYSGVGGMHFALKGTGERFPFNHGPKMADKSLRVVEFYSGVGGMHFALKGCSFPGKVVAAMEINTTANQVYQLNFADTKLLQKNIEGLTVQEVDDLSANVFLMSPPCQPFTRVGLQGASKDPRTRSFLHILELLPKLTRPPDYILMENVKGFECSDTRELFLGTLKSCGYTYQEFLLSPTKFRIPNSRLRYYLLAKRKPLQFCFSTQDKIMESLPSYTTHSNLDQSIPNEAERLESKANDPKDVNNRHTPAAERVRHSTNRKDYSVCLKCLQVRTQGNVSAVDSGNGLEAENFEPLNCRTVGHYLENNKDDNYYEEFLLPGKVLSKFALVLDIVTHQCEHSCCFTKAYGHYAEGTGSVLKMADIDDTEIFNKYRDLEDEEQKSKLLTVLKLRYFTPREVANLHGFPAEFCFPPSATVKQQYRLLGNSLNVHVVSELLCCLFT